MADTITPLRHYGGFLAGGLSALGTDMLFLHLLTTYGGLSPLLARPIGILFAVIVSWAINRRVAFALTAPPSFSEFAKFAAASALAVAVNYLVFAALLLIYPAFHPLAAIVVASLVSMFVSYTGFRFGAFRKPSKP